MLKHLLPWITSLLVLFNVAFADNTVRLMANTSPPYADAKLPEEGLALELVRQVFAKTAYTPAITIDSWSRALEGAALGVYDGLAAAWYSEERDKNLLFSEPYLSSDLVIVKLRSRRGTLRNVQDMAGLRLGVRPDYAYGIDFDTVQDLTLVEENHLIQNLLNLLNGSVDLVIGDQRTMVMQIKEYLADRRHKLEVIRIDLPRRERHVAISRELPGHQDIIAAFNKALAQSRKDGSYDAVLSRWDKQYGGIK